MRRNTVRLPNEEMQLKIHMAIRAISTQSRRELRCPYCRHTAIVVFADTRGHVQTKCKSCGREIVFDVASMRRLRRA